jgi:hypothetical protein
MKTLSLWESRRLSGGEGVNRISIRRFTSLLLSIRSAFESAPLRVS